MKRIECTTDNIAAIDEALRAVNGRATAFAVTDAELVAKFGMLAESRLEEMHVVVSDRNGATATYNPAGPSANSYKYAAASTLITLSRQAGKWYITNIEKSRVWPRQPERFNVRITDKAADNLEKRVMAAFGREMSPAHKDAVERMTRREHEMIKRLPNNPRPWSIEIDHGEAQVVDAAGAEIATFDAEDIEFWRGVVEIVNEHARLHDPSETAPKLAA